MQPISQVRILKGLELAVLAGRPATGHIEEQIVEARVANRGLLLSFSNRFPDARLAMSHRLPYGASVRIFPVGVPSVRVKMRTSSLSDYNIEARDQRLILAHDLAKRIGNNSGRWVKLAVFLEKSRRRMFELAEEQTRWL